MSKIIRGTVAAAFAAAALALPTTAHAAPCSNNAQNSGTWGQEVCREKYKDDPYGPQFIKRGDYVQYNAQDEQGPGYGGEIHDQANPGNASPDNDNHDG